MFIVTVAIDAVWGWQQFTIGVWAVKMKGNASQRATIILDLQQTRQQPIKLLGVHQQVFILQRTLDELAISVLCRALN